MIDKGEDERLYSLINYVDVKQIMIIFMRNDLTRYTLSYVEIIVWLSFLIDAFSID